MLLEPETDDEVDIVEADGEGVEFTSDNVPESALVTGDSGIWIGVWARMPLLLKTELTSQAMSPLSYGEQHEVNLCHPGIELCHFKRNFPFRYSNAEKL